MDQLGPPRFASFLRSSLYTSIVAYGVAAMAGAMGVLFILIGLGMRDVGRHVEDDTFVPART